MCLLHPKSTPATSDDWSMSFKTGVLKLFELEECQSLSIDSRSLCIAANKVVERPTSLVTSNPHDKEGSAHRYALMDDTKSSKPVLKLEEHLGTRTVKKIWKLGKPPRGFSGVPLLRTKLNLYSIQH